MSPDDSIRSDDAFAARLAARDDALAQGRDTTEDDLPDELRRRLDDEVPFLKMLRQALAPSAPAKASPGEEAPAKALGRFQIRRELGRGSYGLVFLAFDPRLDRDIALKVPRADTLVTSPLRERFLREARAAAALDHPNIVPVHEAGEVGPVGYITYAYCPGPTLADWLRSRAEPVPPAEAAALVATLAEAVGHAHTRGIVHRDLKPANILLSFSREPGASAVPMLAAGSRLNEATPKITDFGLARRAEETGQTASGEVLGTPSYMAPEQAAGRGKAAGPAADLYSLGAILYELLTGRPPFQTATALETLRLVVEEEPVPPRRLNPVVPRDLETICLKCLEKEPNRRYDTAEDLADDLKRFLDDRPIKARRVSETEKIWRLCRRNPKTAALVAVAVVLLAVLAVGLPLGLLLREERNEARALLARAEQAERELKLRENEIQVRSHLAQARAYRQSGQVGQRLKCLDEIAKAAALGPPDELRRQLRDEALAALALYDLQPAREFELPPTAIPIFDSTLEYSAFADSRGDVYVHSTADGQEILQIRGLGATWEWLAFSTGGRFLAVNTAQRECHLWDVVQRVKIGQLPGALMYFLGNGKKALTWVSLTDGEMRYYHVASGKEEKRFAVGPGWHGYALSPDGGRLAVSQPRSMQIWDLETGKLVQSVPGLNNVPAWHPNGRFLALGGLYDGTALRVWDLANNRLQTAIPVPTERITAVNFSVAGDLLLSNGWEQLLRVWDPMSGQQLLALDGSDPASLRTGTNADGRWLATTRSGRKVTIWELARPQVTCHALAPSGLGTVVSIDFVPGERLLVLGAKDGVRLWDRAASRELAFLPTGETQAVAHPDGKSIITGGDRGLHRWPLVKTTVEAGPGSAQAEVLRIGPPESLAPPGSYWGVQLADDGRTLAAVNRSRGHGLLIDLQERQHTVATGPHPEVRNAALSPDGKWLATGPRFSLGTGSTKVWDARTGQLVCDLPRDLVDDDTRVFFSPRGTWLVTVLTREYRFWEPGTWQPGRVLERSRHSLGDGPIAFTSNEKLAAIARTNRLVQLINPATGDELANLEVAEQYNINSLRFSPDGSQLVVGRNNHLIHVWDLRKIREQLAKLGLDWDWPPFPPALPTGEDRPVQIQVDLGELASASKPPSQP
jgi:WD40 repeat protein/tRNA A-37 threonylcarbamoyl transferase component Bud32